MKKNLKQVLLVLAAVVMLVVAGCEEKGPMQTAGEKVDDAAEATGDAVKDAAQKTGDSVDDAVNP